MLVGWLGKAKCPIRGLVKSVGTESLWQCGPQVASWSRLLQGSAVPLGSAFDLPPSLLGFVSPTTARLCL